MSKATIGTHRSIMDLEFSSLPENYRDRGVICRPLAPVRWLDVEPTPCRGIHPTATDTAARKYERVRALTVDHGEFQFALKGGSIYGEPIHNITIAIAQPLGLIFLNPSRGLEHCQL